MSRRPPLPEALHRPHGSRLSPSHPQYRAILARHEAAIEDGAAFYIDPASGLWVMTAAKLWERPCCNNGCRHCPWVALDERVASGDSAPPSE
ncbi:MAG: DUF5522 domain-containing protein [Planctomycetota bacterium]